MIEETQTEEACIERADAADDEARDIKRREDRLRRFLRRRWYYLNKTPSRAFERYYYGAGYMVVDDTNTVVLGCCHRQWDATLKDVELFAESLGFSRTT